MQFQNQCHSTGKKFNARRVLQCCTLFLLGAWLAACEHGVEIVGQGRVESASGTRNCTVEQSPCRFLVESAYQETYTPVPAEGWFFKEWRNCGDSNRASCSFDIPARIVADNEGRSLPSVVAVFEQINGVTLSDTVAFPGQFISVHSADILPGRTVEVTFATLDGAVESLAYAPAVERGVVTLPVPPFIDAQGNFSGTTVAVTVSGETAAQSLEIEAPSGLGVPTNGMFWLKTQLDALESLQSAITNTQAIGDQNGADVSAELALLQSKVDDINQAITRFEESGFASYSLGDGELVEYSGEALQQLDNLMLHTLIGLNAYVDVETEPESSNVVLLENGSFIARNRVKPGAYQRILDNIREGAAAVENAGSDIQPGTFEFVTNMERNIRESLRTGKEKSGEFIAAMSAIVTARALAAEAAGDAALAKVAEAFSIHVGNLKIAFAGISASVSEINSDSIVNLGQTTYDGTRELMNQLANMASQMAKTQLPQLLALADNINNLASDLKTAVGGLKGKFCATFPDTRFCKIVGSISGRYSTTYGTMTLNQSGVTVTGVYDGEDGRIQGSRKGNTVTGFWLEPSAGVRCETARGGTRYWGDISFDFTETGFSGSWNYCGNTGGGSWRGTELR